MLHLIQNHAIWYKNMQFDTESANSYKNAFWWLLGHGLKQLNIWSKLLGSGWSHWIFVETADVYVGVSFDLYFHFYYICIILCFASKKTVMRSCWKLPEGWKLVVQRELCCYEPNFAVQWGLCIYWYLLICIINFLVTGPRPRVQTTKTIPMWRINDLLHKGRKGEVAHSFLKDGNWWYKDTEEMTVMCNEKDLHIHMYLFSIFIFHSYWTID